MKVFLSRRRALPILLCLLALAGSPRLAVAAGEANAKPADTSRIVSLGGAVTEILYDLGLGEKIVAVDTTSMEPKEALATKPNVGYLRQLSAEGILSMRPSLVIALEGAGPPDSLKQIEGAGVRIAHVPDIPSPEGIRTKIRDVAHLVGKDAEGEALAAKALDGFKGLDAARARIKAPVKALFVLSLQNGRALVGGRGTSAAEMIRLAGAENAASGLEGFKPMTDEAIVAAAPDVVVMMSQTAPGPDALAGPAFAQTPAGKNKRLVLMDGLYLLGFGPRTPQAVADLMKALYPEAKVE